MYNYGIQDLPVALQGAIQQNFLKLGFQSGLDSILGYGDIAEDEPFQTNRGETITMTRKGRLVPITEPLDPSTNTNFDNGMTPSEYAIEQFTMKINRYGDTMDLNLVDAEVTIADLFLSNAENQGVQARQSMDRITRKTLFNTYMGGNTWVTVTLGAPAATINVDDIRKFDEIVVNGQVLPVSVTNPRPVTVGSNIYQLIGVIADVVNTSSAATLGGISGTLTFSTNVTVLDGTAGNPVVAAYAPVIIRPNARATTLDLTSSDILTMRVVHGAVAILERNAVPKINGKYNMYMDFETMIELYKDEEFQRLYRGNPQREEYTNGFIIELLNVRFIVFTEPFQQVLIGLPIRRPVICGAGTLVRGNFEGHDVRLGERSKNIVFQKVGNILVSVRAPLDRLGELIAQSWSWIGGFAVPTDVTATIDIIPTATDSYYKRAVIIECA